MSFLSTLKKALNIQDPKQKERDDRAQARGGGGAFIDRNATLRDYGREELRQVGRSLTQSTQKAFAPADRWLNARTPHKGVPVGKDEYGRSIVRPYEEGVLPDGSRGPSADDVFHQKQFISFKERTGAPPNEIATLKAKLAEDEKALSGYEKDMFNMRAAALVNDLSARLGNARHDLAENNPVYRYVSPQGNSFTDEDVENVWTVAGRQYKEQDYAAPQVSGYRIVASDDPRKVGEDENGQAWTADMFTLSDGLTLSRDEYLNGELAYRWYPKDGTILEYGDGRVPEETKGKLHKMQTNSNWAGPTDPRSPLSDTAGNSPLDPEYNLTNMVAIRSPKEAIASGVDMALGSALHFHPKLRWPVAISRMLPAMYGYDPDGYEPSGELLGNLDKLGQGTYVDSGPRTNAQIAAGSISPLVEMWAERGLADAAIGGSIGGIPKLALKIPAVRQLAKKYPASAIGWGTFTEAIEEAPGVPFSIMSRDGIENFGADAYYDTNMKSVQYLPTSSSNRFRNVGNELLDNMGGGAMLGGAASTLGQTPRAIGYLADRRARKAHTLNPVPIAPREEYNKRNSLDIGNPKE
ncbi:hypothetical protein [uncultured Halomonas sp.]|uniref:hypothetical protein n=1 Tax=uncultured Halomonas sp. TaxID=173971 RepID=UPI002611E223|nr:hypothetical protein [uncultured Halomonas sp.]